MARSDTIVEHIACAACGYDMYSLRLGQPCPECGTAGRYDRLWTRRVRARRWAVGALAVALAALLPAVALRVALTVSGLSPVDLWGAGRIRPLRPDAVSIWSIPAALIVVLAVSVLALRYRDRRLAMISGCAGAATMLTGWLTLELALLMTGV